MVAAATAAQEEQEQQQEQRQTHTYKYTTYPYPFPVIMSSHNLLLLAVLPLVLGTATAQFFEMKWYNDDGCEELIFTEIADGGYGKNVSPQAASRTYTFFSSPGIYRSEI